MLDARIWTRIYRPVYFPNSFARWTNRGNDLYFHSAYFPPIPFLIIVRRFWLNLAWGKASTVDDWITLLTVATAWLNRRQVPMNRLTISVMGWRKENGGCASGEKEKKARRLHSIAPFLSALECLLPGFRAKSYVSVWSRESFICIRCFVGFKGEMWFCWWGLWKDNLESNW